jgi:hypothetical protein
MDIDLIRVLLPVAGVVAAVFLIVVLVRRRR